MTCLLSGLLTTRRIDQMRLAVGVGRLYAYWADGKLGFKRPA
jgi:hypothetical protein